MSKRNLYELLFEEKAEETINKTLLPLLKKWLSEEIIPQIPFEVVKYKRDEHEAINTSLTASIEEKAKTVVLPHLPPWVNPDMLTALGVVGMGLAVWGYLGAATNRNYLFLVILGLFIHWFGDSFDGTLARFRKKTRPNYGYYIDHVVDAIAVIILGIGLNYSIFVKTDIVGLIVALYLILETHVLIVKTVDNTFKYSIGLVGPTEARIILCFVTLYMYLSPIKTLHILNMAITQYDLVLALLALVMIIVVTVSIYTKARELHKRDTAEWPKEH